MSETIYNQEEQEESNGSGTPNRKTNRPILTGGDENLAAWVSEDKQGNYYLSVELPLGLGSVPVFVNDPFKDAFNQMVTYLIDQGELDEEAIQ